MVCIVLTSEPSETYTSVPPLILSSSTLRQEYVVAVFAPNIKLGLKGSRGV